MTDLPNGVRYRPGLLGPAEQQALLGDIRRIVAEAPLYVPTMPRTGREMSVRMTNCGSLGWLTDKQGGYRYQAHHPATGKAWPAIPDRLIALWDDLAGYRLPPEAGLINFYDGRARMGLHQDRDERALDAPVVSISLGDACRFRIGGTSRNDPTVPLRLESGDVIVLGGESRLTFHGVDRVYPGTSSLLKNGGRINVTLRRVTTPAGV